MMLKASHTSGQIAYNQTIDSLKQATDSMSNTAMMDPNQFGDIVDKVQEMAGTYVNNGQLTQKQAEQFKIETLKKVADGAARGLAQQDPGTNPDGTPATNHLITTLKKLNQSLKDGKDDPSNFYKYLDSKEVSQLENYAREQDVITKAGKEQNIRMQNLAEEQRTKAIMAKAVPGIFDGSFRADQIPGLKLPFTASMELAGAIHRMSTQEGSVNNATVFNNLTRQIGNRTLRDESQILPHLGVDIDPEHYKSLRALFLETPGGENDKTNRNMMLKAAEAKLVKGDPMMGIKDPDGQENLMRFTQALQTEEARMHQEGKPISDLYKVDSKDYFMRQISKYEQTPEQILGKMAGGTTKDMVRVKRKSDGSIGTVPRDYDKGKYEEIK